MTEAERAQIEGHPLLLYDGVCALCNGLVRYMLKRDRRAALRFIPLESSLGREVLGRFSPGRPPEGVVLVTAALTASEQLYCRSDAVAASLCLLAGPWAVAGRALRLIPRLLREPAYSLVARVRYRVFGRYAVCPLPTAEQRGRILGVYEQQE